MGVLKEPVSNRVATAWSGVTNGLSGRLLVEFEDLKPGLRHAVYLELRNYSLNPIAVTNQPDICAELYDSSGKPARTSDSLRSGPIRGPQWAVIPGDAYLGFRIDMQGLGVPTREHGMALIAVGGKAWGLRAGKYVLKIRLTFKKEADPPQRQWIGQLDLLPLEFAVTTEMLRAG